MGSQQLADGTLAAWTPVGLPAGAAQPFRSPSLSVGEEEFLHAEPLGSLHLVELWPPGGNVVHAYGEQYSAAGVGRHDPFLEGWFCLVRRAVVSSA